MPGSTSANFHEGSRSEYLAQYVFACFGTAVAVPRQEDTGLDIYCTLTERLGQEIWPRAYFSVQVKSDTTPWIFPNVESVKWLIEHPLPVFLCVVNKTELSLQVYHTCPRFYAWSLPPLPDRLELTPGTPGEGKCVQWEGGTSYSLSAPILAFAISEIQDETIREKVKEVLKFWIEIEEHNLKRVKSGVLEFSMPYNYKTNGTGYGGTVTNWLVRPSAEQVKRAVVSLEVQLKWVAQSLWTSGDSQGAVRAALLHRPFFNDRDDPRSHALAQMNIALGDKLGKKDYVFQAIDELGTSLGRELEKGR